MDFASSPAAPEVALVGLSQALHARAYRFTAITPASHRSINARPENVCARTIRDVFGWSRPFTEDVLDPALFAAAQAAQILAPARIDSKPAWRSLIRAASLEDLIFLHSAFPTDEADAVFFGPDTHRFAAAIRTGIMRTALDPDPATLPPAGGGFHAPAPPVVRSTHSRDGVPPASQIGSLPICDAGGTPVGVQGAKPPVAEGETRRSKSRAVSISRAIDIGAGAGAGGILIARACPNAEIILADINPAALRMAQVNALAAGITNVRCRVSDILQGVDGTFDLIVANPPYLVDAAARTYRHGGGPLGAALSLRIINDSLPRLNPGGSLLLYTGSAIIEGEDRLLTEIEPMLQSPDLHWHYRELDPDVFGEELAQGPYRHADRIAAVVLTVQRRQ